MISHLVVLGVGVAIGLSIFALVAYFEHTPTPNQPYSHRRDSYSPRTYPSPPPSPRMRHPTNSEPRRRANRPESRDRATSTTSPERGHRATSTTSPERAHRATSPIGTVRHFADYCTICLDTEVVTFQPCGDSTFCRSCAEEFLSSQGRNCPFCHVRIQSIG